MKENSKSINQSIFIIFYNIQVEKGACSRYKMKQNGKSIIFHYFWQYSVGKGDCSRDEMKEKQYINSWEARCSIISSDKQGGGTNTQ